MTAQAVPADACPAIPPSGQSTTSAAAGFATRWTSGSSGDPKALCERDAHPGHREPLALTFRATDERPDGSRPACPPTTRSWPPLAPQERSALVERQLLLSRAGPS